MAHLLARLTPNRFINLNHVIDLSFSEEKDENNEIIRFKVNIIFFGELVIKVLIIFLSDKYCHNIINITNINI